MYQNCQKAAPLGQIGQLEVCRIGGQPETCPACEGTQMGLSAAVRSIVPDIRAVYGTALPPHPGTGVRPRRRLSWGGWPQRSAGAMHQARYDRDDPHTGWCSAALRLQQTLFHHCPLLQFLTKDETNHLQRRFAFPAAQLRHTGLKVGWDSVLVM